MTDASYLGKLFEPFPPERVSWRVGSTTQDKSKGMALAYIDARDVMHRLDDVCGPANWQCRYTHAETKTICEIGIKIGDEWVWKANGAGDTDYEQEKGAMSDAFKRAAVLWGIGRYLYDLDSPWVEVEQKGKTFVIRNSPENKGKLNAALGIKSAHAMKKEYDWTAVMNDLEGDIADAQTVVSLQALYKAWDARRQKEAWPGSFWAQIVERFKERKAQMQMENA